MNKTYHFSFWFYDFEDAQNKNQRSADSWWLVKTDLQKDYLCQGFEHCLDATEA